MAVDIETQIVINRPRAAPRTRQTNALPAPPRTDEAITSSIDADLAPPVIRIRVAGFEFIAREEPAAPKTCAAFRKLLPFRQKLIHARWSGEACWIPLGETDVGVTAENATMNPSPASILFHPPGISEAEILFVYGVSRFASKFGPLAGNHFLTIVDGQRKLPALGRKVLYEGAQDVVFTEMETDTAAKGKRKPARGRPGKKR